MVVGPNNENELLNNHSKGQLWLSKLMNKGNNLVDDGQRLSFHM